MLTFEKAFKEHKQFLWLIGYRMTGSAADADDLVQETFKRLMERPPLRMDEPLRPWLVRVALNLGRDMLRRRKRSVYLGPWLPSPIEIGVEQLELCDLEVEAGKGAETLYEKLESVSFAFLVAIEALTPKQRAVLLLSDVYDYSLRETAQSLGMSEANVKVTLHRARWAMQKYEKNRYVPSPALQKKIYRLIERFISCLTNQDGSAMEALLAEDVCIITDGGEFRSARRPILGQDRVVRFFLGIRKRRGFLQQPFDVKIINGLPAIVAEFQVTRPRQAPLAVLRFDMSQDGLIKEFHLILASKKLTAVRRETSS